MNITLLFYFYFFVRLYFDLILDTFFILGTCLFSFVTETETEKM